MDRTFALRRKEVVTDKPASTQIVQQWPALFSESQVCYEFTRVVGKNLKENLFEALDCFSPNLMDLFRKKKGLSGQLLTDLLRQTKTTEPTDIRCLCLRGLPVVLGDDPSAFFKTCLDATDKDLYSETSVGILFIDEHPQLNPSRMSIVLEGSVVIEELANLPQAFCVLFGLIYALHLELPQVHEKHLPLYSAGHAKPGQSPSTGNNKGKSSGLTCAMKTKKARAVTTTSASCRGKPRFSLRSRKKKDGVIQGKLRIRSMPGAFLVLGVIVVVVGTALAVAGYWPYRISSSSILGATEGESASESQTSGWTLGAKGLLSTATLIHSERMKLLGPVIMGVGLFILICANTVLYENRDRETQMLLAQMHSVICSVSTAVPSADLKEMAAANSMAKHYQWVSTLPAAHLNILCLQQLASSEPLLQTRHPREDSMEVIYRQAVLQTEALHHQKSELPPPLHSSHSKACNSSQTDLNTHSSVDGCSVSFNRQSTPLINLNKCLVSASSMLILGGDEVDIPAAQPRRCHSMSYRTNPYISQPGVHLEEGFYIPREEGHINQLVVTSREAGSHCVNIPWQVVDAVEEQTHRSWPQLDLGNGRRYVKLENKEDSVDKLLDQLEQQCSHWDKSFGSGPFQ